MFVLPFTESLSLQPYLATAIPCLLLADDVRLDALHLGHQEPMHNIRMVARVERPHPYDLSARGRMLDGRLRSIKGIKSTI